MERISQDKRFGIGILAAAIALSACLVASSAQPAYAVTAAEKEAEAEEVLNQINAMQVTLDEASNAYVAALSDYQKAVDKRDAAQKRMDEIAAEMQTIQGRLGHRARDMYRNGGTTFVDLLLGSASFDEFAQNWDLLNRVNESDATLSAQARRLHTEAEEQRAEFDSQAKIADEKAKEAAESFQKASELVEQMQATYNSLSAEARELYAQEQAAAEAAAAAAAAEAAEAEAAEAPTEGGIENDDGTVTDAATGQTYASASEYSSATGNDVVSRARSMIGSSYVWGGVGGSDGGFDCSGLVSYALTGTNERLGTSYTFGDTYSRVDGDPQAGDLYVTDGHVAIYTGEGTLVHAIDESHGVQETTYTAKDGGFFVRP